jgi:hypothetical protein
VEGSSTETEGGTADVVGDIASPSSCFIRAMPLYRSVRSRVRCSAYWNDRTPALANTAAGEEGKGVFFGRGDETIFDVTVLANIKHFFPGFIVQR